MTKNMIDRMTTSDLIRTFLSASDIAIAGVSRDKKKFGYKLFEHLRTHGYSVHPVHPEATQIDGVACYPSFDGIPQTVKHLFVVTPRRATDTLMEQVANRRFEIIWFQQMSETQKSIQIAKDAGAEVITGRCLFMFVDPKGAHGFHRFLMRMFGRI